MGTGRGPVFGTFEPSPVIDEAYEHYTLEHRRGLLLEVQNKTMLFRTPLAKGRL